MARRWCLFFLANVIVSIHVLAQVSVSVIVRSPMPSSLATWERDRTVLQVIITNVGGTSYPNASVSFTVDDLASGHRVMSSRDGNPAIPHFTIPATGTVTRAGTDLVSQDAVTIDASYQSIATTTNRIPEGEYQFCVRLLNQTGTPIATTGASCATFTILIPDPPTLLRPDDAEVLSSPTPVFEWTPVFSSPGVQSQYRVRIAPIYAGQSGRDAVERNTLVYDQTITSTSLLYPPSAPHFDTYPDASGFAWQVQAVDNAGVPVARNDGKSEIRTFRTSGASPLTLEAFYPADHDTIPWLPPHLVVRFAPYADDITAMDYTLTVTGPGGFSQTNHRTLNWPSGPQSGQGVSSPDRAQLIIVDITGPDGWASWTSTMQKGVEYTWSVSATFTKAGRSVTVSSSARHFTLGMQQPQNISPPNATVLPRGSQPDFSWNGVSPTQLNPPDLLGIRRGAAGMQFGLGVEHAKLEISRYPDFSALLATNRSDLPSTGQYNTGDDAPEFYATTKTYRMSSALNDTGTYFWRVSWLREDGSTYLTGNPWMFRISDTATTIASRDTTREGPCIDDCSIPAPTNTTVATRTYRVGDSLDIGRFQMVLTRVSGSAGSLSGEGTIRIPFLRAPIMVEFSSIRVNTDNRVFDGDVTGKQAAGSPISSSVANQLGHDLNLTTDQINSIQDFAAQATRLVTSLTSSTPVGLPIGFDNLIDGERMTIAVMGLNFTPTQATLNAAMAFPLPFLGPGVGLGLGAREICFHPNGIGGNGRGQLYLASDIGYREAGTWSFLFKAPTASDSGTYVAWDCHGFLELRIAAEVEFPRDWLTPAPDDGTSLAKARFYTTVHRGGDWIAAASMDRCTIAGTNGLIMEVQELAFDESDVRNPVGMVFPEGFTGVRDNTWHGFFIRRASITLPEELRTFDTGHPPTIAVTNLMIGSGGFNGSFRAENVIQYPMGNFGEWGASIDTIAIDFVNSSLARGSMTGRFKIPISDSSLIYYAALSRPASGSGLAYEFSIHPSDTINANIWSARLSLNPTSRISLDNLSGSFQASATLSGAITIEGSPGGGPSLGFRGVHFEGFQLMTNSPYIRSGTWSFASEQHNVSGFPVSINDIGLVTGDRSGSPGVGVQFTLAVNLQPGSSTISGATTLSIWGRLASHDGAQSFEFAGVDLDSVGIAADLGAVQIDGGVRFYRGDATFGDGFRGAIHANFVHQVDVAATIQFGTVSDYRYWYVDAKALFTPGIPVFTGVGIYGFGGGAWYHMRRSGGDPGMSTASGGTSSGGSHPGGTNSGYSYLPDEGTEFGFRAMIVIGTYPSSDGFNADVAFEAEFLSGGGIGRISILGDGYMMASVSNRSDAKVTAHVEMTYDFPAQTFHGVFNVNINANPFTGGGQMVMHFEPSTWYIKVGTPHDRVNLNLANWLRIDAYLMMGMDLDAPLELPPEITSVLHPPLTSRNPGISHGDGFAFGASANISTGRLQFLIFYARINAGLGFDIAVLNVGTGVRCEGMDGPVGINGWYATGQMYAYIDASVGIYVDLWFTSGEFEILRVGAAAVLQAGAPNPTWVTGSIAGYYSILGGVVSGNCEFDFKVGDECRPVTESPLARLDLVSDIQPSNGSTNVDVFVQPQAAFNFQVDHNFELRDFTSDGTEEVRTFRIRIRNFTLEQTSTHATVPGVSNLSTDATQSTYAPHDILSAYTQYTATVSVYGEEFVSGAWRRATRADGSSIEQTVTTTFTTGGAPTNIPESNVAYSYPLNRQRFFLAQECPNGLVSLRTGQPDLFGPRTGYTVTFAARFIPVMGGAEIESAAHYNASGRQVEFAIPRVGTNTIFAVQIVRKEVSTAVASTTGIRLGTGGTFTASRTNVTATATLSSIYRHGAAFVQTTTRSLPGTQVRAGETLLYLYYFKTSRYSTLSEKLSSLTSQPTLATPALGNFQILTARFNGPEFFDSYDLDGLAFSRDGRDALLRPLVNVNANTRTDNWHRSFTNPWIYDNIDRFRRMGQWTARVEFERYQMGIGSVRTAEFISDPSPLLQDWEIGPPARANTSRLLIAAGPSLGGAAAAATGPRGVGLSIAPPTIDVQFNQDIPVPIDFSRVQQRAAWYLSVFSGEFLSADDDRWLHGIIGKSFELPYRGLYTLWFGYSFCQDPDRPVSISKTFRY
ncbi:MAG TPA: hypothetical protein VMM37_06645 [Bacteroidota bacterium]|nr:hypothetical protein [Bacteroidota bacterium]